jgi:alginate O-acetyltransferase complex protein AlgI
LLFDTPIYFAFLILVTAVYWRLRHRSQNIVLLAASYIFYGWWDWRFLLLMAASTVVDYVISKRISSIENPGQRRRLLILSLVMNFGFLAYFKYLNFFLNSTVHALNMLGVHGVSHTFLQIVLPPAISFYTFQEVAYIVDVYKGKLEPAENLLNYALFISLFPHLIAGPIQRPSHLLPQVQRARTFDSTTFFHGCLLIVSGLVRKCVIADNCGIIANSAFSGNLGSGWLPHLLGVYAFAFQIYGDFSGYSDIARGSAQLLGFHFMVNFRQPYLAISLQDFWRRWHISLSTWLRDYLYVPLGGSRQGEYRTYRNLLLTMLLGGLWHGANWTFLVWGGLHGAGLAIERFGGLVKSETSSVAGRVLRAMVVFHAVCFVWIFFRADSLSAALDYLAGFAHASNISQALPFIGFVSFFVILGLLIDVISEWLGAEYVVEFLSPALQTGTALAGLLFVSIMSAGVASPFIYFRF